MIDQKKFRRKFLLELATHPLTLYPFVGGATILASAATFGWRSSTLIMAGIAGVLGSIGMFLHRFLAGDKRIAEKVYVDIRKEEQGDEDREYDELAALLGADRDTRDDRLLEDLRTLAREFRKKKETATTIDIEISMKVDELIQGCFRSLKKSFELLRTAKEISSRKTKKAILDKREEILREVEESIAHVGKIISGLGTASEKDDSGDNLARLREELDQNLEISRRTEERMRELDREYKIKE